MHTNPAEECVECHPDLGVKNDDPPMKLTADDVLYTAAAAKPEAFTAVPKVGALTVLKNGACDVPGCAICGNSPIAEVPSEETEADDDVPDEGNTCSDCGCLCDDNCDGCGFSCLCCNDHCADCGHISGSHCAACDCACPECCGPPPRPRAYHSTITADLEAVAIFDEHRGHKIVETLDLKTNLYTTKFPDIVEKKLGSTDIVQGLGDFYAMSWLTAMFPRPSGDELLGLMPSERGFLDKVHSNFDNQANELAGRIEWYGIMSCVGEARHALGHSSGDLSVYSPLTQALATAGSANKREPCWVASYYLVERFGKVAILEACRSLFEGQRWGGNIGGKAWANVATEMGRRDELGNVFFVDHVIDIVHNGGWAFGKYFSPMHTHHTGHPINRVCPGKVPGYDEGGFPVYKGACHDISVHRLLNIKKEVGWYPSAQDICLGNDVHKLLVAAKERKPELPLERKDLNVNAK